VTTYIFFYDSLTSTFLSSAVTQLPIFLSSFTVLLLILLFLFFYSFFSQLFLLLSTQFFVCFLPQRYTVIILLYPSGRLLLVPNLQNFFCYTISIYGISYYTLLLYFTYYLLVRLPSITLQIFLMSESDPATSPLESFMLGRVGFIEHA